MDFNIMFGFLLMILFVVLFLTRKRKIEERKPLKVNIEVRCKKCNNGRINIDGFKDGDYLYKSYGICKCGGQLIITKIYTTDKTDAEKKWDEYEQRFRV